MTEKTIIKRRNKYITVVNYTDKILLVLPGASSGVFLFSSNTVIGTPVGMANAGISLVFLVSNAIVKMLEKKQKLKFSKQWGKNKHRKTALLTKSKLNIVEEIMSCRLLTAKPQNLRRASQQPATMGSCLTICQTGLPCPHLVDGCGCSPGLGNGNIETVKFATQL